MVGTGAKPAWLNELTRKGLPVKAQSIIEKEMGVLTRAGIFKPPKKAAKLNVSTKAVAMKSIKKIRPT